MSKIVPLEGFGRIEKEYVTIIEDSTLNFDIVAYATKEELAAAQPKENTIGVITDINIHAWDFSVTEPQMNSNNKNLLVYPYSQTTKTHNGVTFTDNGDGTITANGTATNDAYFYLIHPDKTMIIEGGTYALTGCPEGGSSSTYILRVYDNSTGSYWEDTGNGRIRELSTNGMLNLVCFIRIKSGVTVSNLVFKPQFEKGSTATSYVKGDATGQVWITTGTFGTVAFNALKKNSIQIYPLIAKQYINGTWVDKTAKSYQNGAWTDLWNGELYVNGHQYESITGGWWKNPSLYRESYTTQGNLAFSNSIVMSAPSSQTTNATTRKKIDLTNYNELVFDFSGNTSDISEIYIHSLESGRIDNSSLVVAKGTSSPISLTGITGSYYISIIAWNDRYPSFNNIKLVR